MKPVDNLWITRREHAQKPVDNLIRLTSMLRFTSSFRAASAVRSGRTLKLLGGVYVLAASVTIGMQPATALTKSIDHYKLYAHSRIINYEQYKCLSKIIYKESRWNPQAKNGSHFGLGQMRSQHYRTLDAYRQIDATIKYITGRYGSMCNAWRFHIKNGHY
jgi:membrane-bound lytic murein transglycosylase MltF